MSKKRNMPLPSLSGSVNIVDTHCHLDMSAYDDDRDEIISTAFTAGVAPIITIGIDLQSSRRAVRLAEKHQTVMAAVGVHPHNVGGLKDTDYDELRSLATNPQVVAYGEIGLDFVKQHTPVAEQLLHFRKQAQLAQELKLPLIIHDRGAHSDILKILRELTPFRAGGVMHCFSGDINLAREVVELGFHISIPGIVTFNKAADLQEVAKEIDISALILETDGPFLAPVPKRGKRNEPAFVLYTAAKIAELRNMELEEVARLTTDNAQNLFRFKDKGLVMPGPDNTP